MSSEHPFLMAEQILYTQKSLCFQSPTSFPDMSFVDSLVAISSGVSARYVLATGTGRLECTKLYVA